MTTTDPSKSWQDLINELQTIGNPEQQGRVIDLLKKLVASLKALAGVNDSAAAPGAPVATPAAAAPVAAAALEGGKKKKSSMGRGKKRGGALPLDGAPIVNTSYILNNDPTANIIPKPWDGPLPFSAGTSLPATITDGLPMEFTELLDPKIHQAGGKKKKAPSKPSAKPKRK